MAREFNRDELTEALDAIGAAAVETGTRLEICVYGGSALMLASNFRFSTEDVDIAELDDGFPEWLDAIAARIAAERNWSADWFNDGIKVFLSSEADRVRDHIVFGSFPRRSDRVGLVVHVPTARYLLALKLRALRMGSASKARKDLGDVRHLVAALGITSTAEALAVLFAYFPQSAADCTKQRFVLDYIFGKGATEQEPLVDAPFYPRSGVPEDRGG